jgi:uncharacterized OB-fold protein
VRQAPSHAVAPVPTPDSEEFWSACNDGRLLLRECESCQHRFYYPRLACPRCAQRELRWIEASGRGVVYSHTTVFTSFYGSAWEADLPYTVLLVDLDEGPRMLSRLVGDDEELRAGAPVEVDFYEMGDRRYPYFKLDSSSPP